MCHDDRFFCARIVSETLKVLHAADQKALMITQIFTDTISP